MAKATPQETTLKTEPLRPIARFPPSAWGHFFVDFVQDESKLNQWSQRALVLKEKVKKILRDARGAPFEIHLIDVIKRVGLDYQFEAEIEDALNRLYSADVNDVSCDDGDDLYHEALRFRVLRAGGYKASADVFEKYKDEEGKFKECLTKDVKSLLCLYEAAFLGIRGEDILDEAIAFTTEHLKSSLTSNLDPLLKQQVQQALEIPTHKRLPRINARKFISFYEESEGKTSEDIRTLIEYAKLDFNLVQAVHQREIKNVSKWWKEKGLAEKLPYARNRAVECYVWNMSVTPEPRFSRSREFAAKTLSMVSLTDDTYDAYGIYEELEQYTNAIQRWDLAAMDDLAEYMKPLYLELVTLFKETEEKLEQEGYSYQIGYVKEAIQELCREGYFAEAKWYHDRYTPGIEEYIRVALKSSGYEAVFVLTMVFMEEASVEAFEWWKSKPRIIVAITEICRFLDDLVAHKFEQERGHIVSSVECFMEEKGMTEKEVINLFKNFYNLAWKDINETCLRPTPFPMYILGKAVNLGRMMEAWYKSNGKDGYTFSGDRTKEMITALLVDPIPI
ncbi:viridiflorene synthase-like [Aristolochia californica]|uniref:viridiflorene synthase-like n=1 Tax=Aristolochia californica TaxID=171875 RepID=UPI0035DD5BBD